MVQTAFGLQLEVQLLPIMQVYITVPNAYHGKTSGACLEKMNFLQVQ